MTGLVRWTCFLPLAMLATGPAHAQPAAAPYHGTNVAVGGNEPGRGLGERLAIDPNHTSTLFFGSRHDGLWRSDDGGALWYRAESFPVTGLGPQPRTSHGGVSFVVVDPGSAREGEASQRIWVGVADPGTEHLFRSDDGGRSWRAMPAPALFAAKAAIDFQGTVYVGHSDGIGPSDARTGAVWRYRPEGSAQPVTPPGFLASGSEGGFLGVAAAPPGMVAVSTIDRYRAGDTVWLSRDGGGGWDDLGARSRRDVSATPFPLHEGKGADFGHWISRLAVDPFDPAHIAYTTGATLYATRAALWPGTIEWAPWVLGIEQTAIITLISPTGGAPLISGFGDLAGFVHDDLARSPLPSFTNPYFSNTNTLDYAGLAPQIVVRSGSLYGDRARAATLGWSSDGGRTWHPLQQPAMGEPARRVDLTGEVALSVSADGEVIFASAPEPMWTRDRGASWERATGLPGGVRVVADKRDPRRFYAVDPAANRLLISRDGGRSFVAVAGAGLPGGLASARITNREQQSPLVASPFAAGELWLKLGTALFRSADGGASFVPSSAAPEGELYGLGRGDLAPNLFAVGTLDGVRGIWRSRDAGAHWARINDDTHQWGLRFRAISGDPRRADRVYPGTDGRGLFYGDPMEEE